MKLWFWFQKKKEQKISNSHLRLSGIIRLNFDFLIPIRYLYQITFRCWDQLINTDQVWKMFRFNKLFGINSHFLFKVLAGWNLLLNFIIGGRQEAGITNNLIQHSWVDYPIWLDHIFSSRCRPPQLLDTGFKGKVG